MGSCCSVAVDGSGRAEERTIEIDVDDCRSDQGEDEASADDHDPSTGLLHIHRRSQARGWQRTQHLYVGCKPIRAHGLNQAQTCASFHLAKAVQRCQSCGQSGEKACADGKARKSLCCCCCTSMCTKWAKLFDLLSKLAHTYRALQGAWQDALYERDCFYHGSLKRQPSCAHLGPLLS